MINKYKIMCTGANLNNLINICRRENIELFDVSKLSNNKMSFEINDSNYKRLIAMSLNGYLFEVCSVGGVKGLRRKLLYRVGVLIGIVLSLLLVLFFNNRLINIKVNGLEYIKVEDVLKTLNDNNIKYMAKMDYKLSDIEEILTKNYNFSMVSVIKRGNSLIINIKEELKSIEEEYVEIVSDYNMVIKDIDVYSGTANVSAGDIVKKGDTLVNPYIVQNNEIVFVKPSAKIIAEIFYADRFDFKNVAVVSVRSGKSVIVNENAFIGNFEIYNNNHNVPFQKFEVVNDCVDVSNYFIPIRIYKERAFELVDNEIVRDFSEEKENIISSLKNNVYSMNRRQDEIIEEDVLISQVDWGYIVTYYIKCSLQLNYN